MRRVISPPPHHNKTAYFFFFFLAFFFAAIGASLFNSPAGIHLEVGVLLRREDVPTTLPYFEILKLYRR
jgi:hypothetical protein